MAKIRTSWFLLLFVSLCGCSAVNVHYDYEQAADFSTLQTFAFRSATVQEDILADNPLLKKRITGSVEQYLVGRGYTRAETDLPDMYIALHATEKEKMRVTDWGPGGFYSDYRDSYRWGGSFYYGNRVDVSYYTETTLVIDVFQAESNELIWRGTGTTIVRKYDDPQKMQQVIDSYVAEIMTHFPPGNESQ